MSALVSSFQVSVTSKDAAALALLAAVLYSSERSTAKQASDDLAQAWERWRGVIQMILGTDQLLETRRSPLPISPEVSVR